LACVKDTVPSSSPELTQTLTHRLFSVSKLLLLKLVAEWES
jgi:hypothetical protein